MDDVGVDMKKYCVYSYDIGRGISEIFLQLDGEIDRIDYIFNRDILAINFMKRMGKYTRVRTFSPYIYLVMKSNGRIIRSIDHAEYISLTDDYLIYRDTLDNRLYIMALGDYQKSELNLGKPYNDERYSFASIDGHLYYIDNFRSGLFYRDSMYSGEELLFIIESNWKDFSYLSEHEFIYTSPVDGVWQIHKIDIEDNIITQITDSENSCFNPSVSLDGRRILFDSLYGPEREMQLYKHKTILSINIDGTDMREVLNTYNVTEFYPIWIK